MTDASEKPVRIRIRDGVVTIMPADDLWGLDTIDALEALSSAEGRGATEPHRRDPYGQFFCLRTERLWRSHGGKETKGRLGGWLRPRGSDATGDDHVYLEDTGPDVC
jgi:hypothetical protein